MHLVLSIQLLCKLSDFLNIPSGLDDSVVENDDLWMRREISLLLELASWTAPDPGSAPRVDCIDVEGTSGLSS